MVACGGEVVVMDTHNAAAIDDAVTAVGVVTTVVVWVQQCWMRACTNL